MIRVYADTSVFGGCFDEEFNSSSLKFLEEVRSGRFLLAISPVLEEEISDSPKEVQSLYHEMAVEAEICQNSVEAVRLQDAYSSRGNCWAKMG